MEIPKRNILSLLISLASLVVIVAGLKATSSLLSPILLSVFIVLVTSPIMAWMKGKGVPGWLAYMLLLLGVIAVGLFSLFFFAVSLNQLSQELPNYTSRLETQLTGLTQWLKQQGVTSEDIQSLEWFQPDRLLRLVFTLLSALLGTVSNVGLTLLVYIYMLASAPNISVQLRRGLVGNMPMLERLSEFSRSMSTYLLIKSWLGAVTALTQILLMWIMGVDFPVLWGVLSFFFNFVPNIGFYIALVPPLLIAILKLGIWKALLFGLIYGVINNFFDIAIAPRYLGKGLDLSALVSFLAVILWTWILGPIGAFMALPLTVMVKKIVLESFPETQLFARLLSSEREASET